MAACEISVRKAGLSESERDRILTTLRAFDLPTFGLVTFILACVAMFASYIPAQRATRADPMIALGRG